MSVFLYCLKSVPAAALALLLCQGCGQTGALYLPQPELPQQAEPPQANSEATEADSAANDARQSRTSRP